MNPLDAEVELAIYRAFLRLPADRLPSTPFMLNSWTRINDDRWFHLLRTETQTAIDYLTGDRKVPPPRQKSGALLGIMQQLKPLIRERSAAA